MKDLTYLRSPLLAALFFIGFNSGPLLRAQTLLDLDPGGDEYSAATSINDSGNVVGYGENFGGAVTLQGFIYTPAGSSTPLNVANSSYVMPNGINNSNEITGLYADRSTNLNGFYYANGAVTELNGHGSALIGGSVGNGINDSGVVAGTGLDSQYNSYAFYYKPATNTITTISSSMVDAAAGNDVYGIAINATGLLTGYSQGASNPTAFIYNTTTSSLVSGNLGGLGGGSTMPTAINSQGQVVGVSTLANGNQDAFLYSSGSISDIGNLGGTEAEALGINNAGAVVGFSSTAAGGVDAFLYSASTGMQDLDLQYASLLVPGGGGSPAGFISLDGATAVNSSGEVVGYGDYWTGTESQEAAFLLDPTGIAMAPEPGTWALLVGGIGLLGAVRQIRRAKHS